MNSNLTATNEFSALDQYCATVSFPLTLQEVRKPSAVAPLSE
jgi:hypothetical protein